MTNHLIIQKIEQVFFSNRPFFLAVFALITVFLGWQALQLEVNASMLKTMPYKHEFVTNFLNEVKPKMGPGAANQASKVRVVVSTTKDDIFTKDYLLALEKIHETIFYIPGVDRGGLLSLRSPTPQWIRITTDGVENGVLMPNQFTGSDEQLAQIKQNVIDSPYRPFLVGNDFKSSAIIIPLLSYDSETGEEIDAVTFSQHLENKVRQQFQSDSIKIHIIGQVKILGDIIAGAIGVIQFFGIAFLVITCVIFWYSRDVASTLILVFCSSIAVIWQLGIVKLYGGSIDPYTLLRPFLIFTISVSHGVQMINAVGLQRISGDNGLTAAAKSFQTLLIPGCLALISDAIGFLVLLQIDIPIILDLAIGAAAGVAVIIFTNMFLLPAMLSYVDTSAGTIRRLARIECSRDTFSHIGAKLATKRVAIFTVTIAILLYILGILGGKDVKLGDFEPGAAELHQDSIYNQDQAYIDQHYTIGTDELILFISTYDDHAASGEVVHTVDQLEWALQNTLGVIDTQSVASHTRYKLTHFYDLNWKWYDLPLDDHAVYDIARKFPGNNPNLSLTIMKIILADHKDETMVRVVDLIENFANDFGNEKMQFILGGGSIAKDYGTNRVIAAAQAPMLMTVHIIVVLLCWMTFKSLRAAICIVVPLALTTVLTHALMAQLGIGLKLATLPIVALGVGIGVDYGIYIFGRFKTLLARGMDVKTAYFYTLKITGKAVGFAGLTLSLGVSTWIFSDLKFQADMGLMLTFMFMCNMVGAITILPGLAVLLIKTDRATCNSNKNISLAELMKEH